MDRKEAQLILSALRPGGAEANEPLFSEALMLTESDPELNAWWQAQQSFDRRLAAKLREIPVPATLRDEILAAPKVVALPPQWQHRSLLAAAAAVAILCVATSFWRAEQNNRLDRLDFVDQVVGELGTKGPELAEFSTDHEQVKAWLKERNAPVADMPANLQSLPSIGCQEYIIHGHVVSVMCFTLTNGREAHLFTVDKSALRNPPSSTGPQFAAMSGWNLATWSDSRMTYVLATNGSMDDLKQLL